MALESPTNNQSPPLSALIFQRLGNRALLLLVILGLFFFLYLEGYLSWTASFLSWIILSLATLLIKIEDRQFRPRRLTSDMRARIRKRTEKKTIHALVNRLHNPTIVLDEKRHTLSLNKPAKDYFPILETDVPLSRVIRAPEILSSLDKMIKMNEPLSVDYVDGGSGRSLKVFFSPFAVYKEKYYSLISFRDLTERDKLDKMRSDFVANASHELKTPLSSMIGYIETLQGNAADDKQAQKKFLGIMEDQAKRMDNLINDLLSLSRLEMNVHLAATDPVSLKGTLDTTLQTLAPLIEKRKAKVVLDIDDDFTLMGDNEELNQLFLNLMQNALKYGQQGGTITVSASAERDPGNQAKKMVKVSILDEGPGIDPQHIPRLTERFYRVDVDASRAQGGTGLGLAIVKHILNRLGGHLEIHSEKDKGSNFSVTIPLFQVETT